MQDIEYSTKDQTGDKKHILKLAPEFKVKDVGSDEIKLSQFRYKKHILLVFNRGFT